MQSLIFYILLATSCVGWFTFAFCALWYWQRERRERTRIRQTKADIADIMLLFQTMRDVVMQQKQLANDFNEELERKVGGVKQILSSSLEKNERLYERQREIERELEETKAELHSLQRQLSYMPLPSESRQGRPAPMRPEGGSVMQDDAPPFVALPGEDAPPPAPEAASESPAAADTSASAEAMLWEQVDLAALSDNTVLGGDDDEEEELLPPPADGEAAREAFRALLDLSTATPPQEPAGGKPATPGGVALQQRILQYAEAGMSVGDIARELGIGKGEVRLMLSLAKPTQS
jgi:hypothetical protein